MKLKDIIPNPANPRLIKDERFKKLCQSIKDFPKMLELRPIIIDDNNVILGGNMRYKALKELGHKEIPDTWVKRADELTDDEKRRFIIEDNVGFGEWDWEMLANEWDEVELGEWGLELAVNDNSEKTDISDKLFTEFKIEVECADESEQELIYNKLLNDGYKCRLLTL